MNVGFISLGCSKNLVDTEMMIGLFKKKGYKIVTEPKEADIIVINTCGFIESAKEEAINTILEMAEYKKKKCKYLIATGCLIERYKEELIKELPEVDLFVKFSEYDTIWKQIEQAIKQGNKQSDNNSRTNEISTNETSTNETSTNETSTNEISTNETSTNEISTNEKLNNNEIKKDDKTQESKLDFCNRIISTGNNYAYLRIAEGCDNFCTFCAIPYIRGRFRSRTEEDILKEAEKLTKEGTREIIIIAQDTTKYGIDIYGKPKLAELLHKISQIDGIEWIRFLYSYPETITEELIKEVKENDKICKYFDIPMQHISDKILKKMNRKTTKESTMKLITKLRREVPNVIIRSTLMVGFPGETKEDFEELYDFVKWAKFDKLGCFAYSKEEGTGAYTMNNQIHPMTKKARLNKIMKLQNEISTENLKKYIGKTYKVLIEDAIPDEENGGVIFVGRTYMDVPEIDGYVYLKGNAEINTFVKCKITEAEEYDLIGKII